MEYIFHDELAAVIRQSANDAGVFDEETILNMIYTAHENNNNFQPHVANEDNDDDDDNDDEDNDDDDDDNDNADNNGGGLQMFAIVNGIPIPIGPLRGAYNINPQAEANPNGEQNENDPLNQMRLGVDARVGEQQNFEGLQQVLNLMRNGDPRNVNDANNLRQLYNNWVMSGTNQIQRLVNEFTNMQNRFDEKVISTLTETALESLKELTYQEVKKLLPELTDDYKCSICFSELKENSQDEKYVDLPCHHIHHAECIKMYLSKHDYQCPVCRASCGEHISHV